MPQATVCDGVALDGGCTARIVSALPKSTFAGTGLSMLSWQRTRLTFCQAAIKPLVTIFENSAGTAIGALGDMVRMTGDDDTGGTNHGE
jgi:hypothetical protein